MAYSHYKYYDIYIYKIFFNVYTPRAISITRTLFRLNTNQSFAYENFPAYLYT